MNLLNIQWQYKISGVNTWTNIENGIGSSIVASAYGVGTRIRAYITSNSPRYIGEYITDEIYVYQDSDYMNIFNYDNVVLVTAQYHIGLDLIQFQEMHLLLQILKV